MNLLLTILINNFLYFFISFQQLPNYTKKWHSNEKSGQIVASFEEFNGKQDFKVKRNREGSFMLFYSVNLEDGKLSIEIKSSSKAIVQREISGSLLDSIKLDNSNGVKYQVIFRAVHARGKFELKYN